jgi:hypothetical protein
VAAAERPHHRERDHQRRIILHSALFLLGRWLHRLETLLQYFLQIRLVLSMLNIVNEFEIVLVNIQEIIVGWCSIIKLYRHFPLVYFYNFSNYPRYATKKSIGKVQAKESESFSLLDS